MQQPGALVAGKYRLERQIGSGGMAHVWKAEHELLHRPVAIKFLDVAGPASGARTERFLREARMAAALRERHVVDVLDYGTTDDRQPYMVMEYLEGQTLADRLESAPPLTDAALVDLVAQIADGLAAVHEAGIIHRDVKPENVFLVERSGAVLPKLLDFGISKGFGDGPTQQKLTSTGAVVGTPHYMSPEQARGMRNLDPRTDVYSLGVILYEALAGCVPFDSENPGDILIMIVTQEARPIELFRPDLPAEVGLVVERAMAKDRDARHRTARELSEALHDILPLLGGSAPARRVAPRRSTTGQSATGAQRPTLDEAPALPTSRAPLHALLALVVVGVLAAVAWAGFAASDDDSEPTAPAMAASARTSVPASSQEPARSLPAPRPSAPVVEEPPAPAPLPSLVASTVQPPAPIARRTRRRTSAPSSPEADPASPRDQRPPPRSAPQNGYFDHLDY